jgi:hypothetical protein
MLNFLTCENIWNLENYSADIEAFGKAKTANTTNNNKPSTCVKACTFWTLKNFDATVIVRGILFRLGNEMFLLDEEWSLIRNWPT